MNKITFVTALLLFVTQLNFGQDKHSRIKINNPNQATMAALAKAGIDLRCGALHDHNSLTLELSDTEIESLKQNNIFYQVEIEDLTKFYSERAEREMPKAQEELKKEKLKSKKPNTDGTSNLSKSISNTIIDSYLQYHGEQEVDWTPPTNFNIPSTFGGCLKVSETEAELDAMRAAYPNLISVKTDASPSNQTTYGFTGTNGWAGQTVYYVKISDNPDGADDPNEPDILYTSMIHSRELSSLMGNIYFMWYLLENYATDSAIKHLVDNNELFFVPIINPDGLRWNEKEDPNGGGMNRTNLRGYPTATNNSSYIENYGVDPNRNFDYLFGSAGDASGSSGTYTSSTYRGPTAFSEPESQIMRDFILAKNFKTAVWQHSYANGIPHPYGGIPTKVSGREDEMARWHQDMTKYNRYIYGANVLSPANGIADDWMLGGTADSNSSVGSGLNILATTPENGANDGSEGGFWPAPTQIVPIAKRMVRINLMNAYYGGKYAKFHDLTQSDISATISNLTFGIERVGQTNSNFTITVTPISSNIASVGSAVTETGMSVLEQRNVTIQLNLNTGILANEKIEYKVTLSNSDGAIYEANFEKYYNPSILFLDNPDSDNLSNWTSTGDWATTSDNWSGTTAIRFGTSSPYGINKNRTLTTSSSYDLSGSDKTIIQFYSKWDMERNFDFVEFQGSTDGTNWVSLKGNYNKPESSSGTNSARSSYNSTKNSYFTFQSNSLGFIYDGDQMDNWVMEEIAIDASNNSSLFNAATAEFRFVFRSDGNNSIEKYSTTLDGFYFDDFKIIGVQIPCDNTNPPTGLSADIVTSASAVITWDNIPSATYDLRYREVGAPSWTEITDISTNSYNITGLTDNTDYEVQIATRCVTTTSSYSTSETFTTAIIVPCTGSSISSYPYTETFDSGLGLWTQGANDIAGSNYEDWTLNSGGTVSTGTGPTDDFTGGGNYLYTEASNANATTNIGQNVTVTLISPCIDLTGYENANFSFYYHMVGDAMGDLSVDLSIDNGSSWNQLDANGNIVTNTPILSGSQQTNQTEPWLQQNINLSNYDGQVIKLRFSGTTGTTWSSDIAIDQLNITADVAVSSTPPTAVCQNINVQLDATGNATIIATDVDGGSSDDVAITNYSIDITSFDCSNIGTPVDVTLTVEDGDGQTDTCVASVTVLDQVKPTFVNVPTDITLYCGNNNPTWTDPTATDNCDATLTVNRTDVTGLNSGDLFPTGITIISYEVTDDYGNTETDSFSVNILVDNTNPVAIAQDISVQLDAFGNATIVPSDINNGSSDNCGIGSLSLSIDTFDCSNLGGNTVILTVTDTNGNTDTANATVTITQQDAPTPTNCWDNYVYNSISCLWENTGSQPAEPTTECWETATFNDTTCSWDVTGTQPTEPTTECWETATFNDTTCSWDVTGTQPAEPTTECWETATFNDTTCIWDVTGTQPVEPTTECWETATFNDTTCSWDVTGTQPAEPTTECWETAAFNDTTCSWDVTGTQPAEPTTECWETATFNDTTCIWDVTGTQPVKPTTECWETATFNDTTCSWDITGTQPAEPTTECWETATFNDTTCSWDITGTQPAEPTTECWETATFNDTTCSWDVTGTQLAEPTTECWETATFNNTTCSWDITGTQPAEPTTECWETATFNDTTCVWDVTGTQPAEPSTECWETSTFNDTTCVWDVTISDTELPVAICMNITVELDTFGNATIIGTDVDGGSTDNCEIANYSVTPNTFTLANLGSNTVTMTITDAAGNSDDCMATVTVETPTLDNEEVEYNNEVSIYPNPFKDYINITLPISFIGGDSVKIEILDIRGRLIKRLIKDNISGTIVLKEFNEFENGSYFIKITNKTSKVIFKQLLKNE